MERPHFAQVAAVALFVVVALFFFGLLVPPRRTASQDIAAERRDFFAKSVGFLAVLGAIRTFIVPKRVDAFPILADYVALAVFLVVFCVGAWRVLSLYWPTRVEDDKWAD